MVRLALLKVRDYLVGLDDGSLAPPLREPHALHTLPTPTILTDWHQSTYPGEIDVYVNGKTIISVRGLIFREGPEAAKSRVQGMHFQTFFGGMSHLSS